MGVSLTKGAKISLTKAVTNGAVLNLISAAIGWDMKEGKVFDLDVSAVCLGENGKVTKDGDLVYFGNMEHPTGALKHTGDNRTGAGEGDDETINIELSKIPADIVKVQIIINIFDGKPGENFGQVKNATSRIYTRDEAGTELEELARYDLEFESSTDTDVVIAELIRRNGEWIYSAEGESFTGGLATICNRVGIAIEA